MPLLKLGIEQTGEPFVSTVYEEATWASKDRKLALARDRRAENR